VSDKTGWEGRGQQLGTRMVTVWTLSQALGQAKENKYGLESLDGYIVSGRAELKRKFWLRGEGR
jgi:phage/plasmid-associated DNA primase